MEIFNKNQTAELEKKFTGYTVLAAARAEQGIFVCLMARNGSMAMYTMAAENETIAPEKITTCNAQVHFTFGEEEVCVNACDVTDRFVADLTRANSAKEQAEGELEQAKETIRTMETNERKRRCEASKAAAERELADINANRDEDKRFNEEIIHPVLEAAERGDYTECCDGDVWVGDTMAKNAVRAAAMEAQMAQDKAAAEAAKRANQKKYAWEGGTSSNNEDSLEAMYRSMTKA